MGFWNKKEDKSAFEIEAKFQKQIEELQDRMTSLVGSFRELNKKVSFIEGVTTGTFSCAGGVNGNKITEPTRSDIDKVILYAISVNKMDNCSLLMKINPCAIEAISYVSGWFALPQSLKLTTEGIIGSVSNVLVVVDSSIDKDKATFCIIDSADTILETYYLKYTLWNK